MIRSPRALATSAAIVAALLSLSACSGGDGDGGSSSADAPSPLQEYFEVLYGGQDFDEEAQSKLYAESEELVAKCMTEQGFEYTPASADSGMVSFGSADDGPMPGSKKFVEEYGYGIVDGPWDSTPEPEGGETSADPNAEYVESLSESEQTAYSEALHGPAPSEEDQQAMQDGTYSPDFSQMGCYGQAQQETMPSIFTDNPQEDPEFADLFEDLNTLYDGIYGSSMMGSDATEADRDPGIVKLDEKWQACMVKAGYEDYDSPMDAQTKLQEEFYPSTEALPQNGLAVEEPVESDTAADKEKRKEFKKKELAVAKADFDCKRSLDYDDKVRKISNDLEQKFIDEHKAELDALIAKYGADEKKEKKEK